MKPNRVHKISKASFSIPAAAAILFSFVAPITAEAASIVYDNPTGNWTTADNWNPKQLPVAADSVFIRMDRNVTVNSNVGSITTVYLGQNTYGGTLTLESGGSLAVSANFEVMRQGNYNNIGGTLAMNGGSLTVASTLFVGVGGANTAGTSSGTANISGGTLNAAITVGSTLGTSIGYFNVIGTTAAISGSTFAVNSSGRIAFAFGATGVSALNYTTANFASGSLFSVDGSLYTGPGGDIKLVDSNSLAWNVQPGGLSITGFNGYTTELLTANNDVILRLTAVPEPTPPMLALAALPFLGCRRRRVKISA